VGTKTICEKSALPDYEENQAMNSKIAHFFLPAFGFVLLFISSCGYDDELAYLNDQVVALNKRVKSLEDTMDTRLGPMRSSQAGFQSDIDRIQGQIGSLSGRIEQNEHLLKRAVERDLGDEDSMKSAVDQLSEKVTKLDAMVEQQRRYLGLEVPAAKETEAQRPAPAVREEPRVKPGPAPVQPPAASRDVDLYDRSLALYRDEKYEQAIDGFKEFLKTYPKSDRADNAQFWIGESHMALKQYEQAILAYQEVIKKYPKGNKAANATLRQAMAFLEINDKTSAKLLFGKVVKNYPNSNEAKLAQKKLETLK
jgi:tol-pal system protein YbgF